MSAHLCLFVCDGLVEWHVCSHLGHDPCLHVVAIRHDLLIFSPCAHVVVCVDVDGGHVDDVRGGEELSEGGGVGGGEEEGGEEGRDETHDGDRGESVCVCVLLFV